MNRLFIVLLASSPFVAAEPLHLFCEGYEATNVSGPQKAPVAASHSVMLDKIKGTIAVGHTKGPYKLTADKDAYRVAYKAEDGVNHTIELNRHSLAFRWMYMSGDTYVSFRGQCTLFDPKI